MAYSIKDRWLIAENIDGSRQYIIHTHKPRFIAEILDNEEGGNDIGEFEFIDEPAFDAAALAKLGREAGDALVQYELNLDLQEFDNDED
jgi:hypothetical protein